MQSRREPCTCDICFGVATAAHGASSYVRFACRCDVCVTEASARRAKQRAKRREAQ